MMAVTGLACPRSWLEKAFLPPPANLAASCRVRPGCKRNPARLSADPLQAKRDSGADEAGLDQREMRGELAPVDAHAGA